jgi:pimeloyl-ACP methyl ester carboxylesterase
MKVVDRFPLVSTMAFVRLLHARTTGMVRPIHTRTSGLVSTITRLPGVDLDFAVESAIHVAGPDAPWAVCFHSSGLGARQWAVGPELAPTVNWIAVNFAGYGDSTPWPREQRLPSLADQASLVCASVDSLVPRGAELHLLAHSYGGSIALASCPQLAAERRVASLVIYEPNSFFLLDEPERSAFTQVVHGWLQAYRTGDDEDFMRRFYAFCTR